jgi:hypothetical protein
LDWGVAVPPASAEAYRPSYVPLTRHAGYLSPSNRNIPRVIDSASSRDVVWTSRGCAISECGKSKYFVLPRPFDGQIRQARDPQAVRQMSIAAAIPASSNRKGLPALGRFLQP